MDKKTFETKGYRLILLSACLFCVSMSLANAPALLWLSLVPILVWQLSYWKDTRVKWEVVIAMLAYAIWAYLSLIWTPEFNETLKFLKREVFLPFVIFILFFNIYHKRIWPFLFTGAWLGLATLVLLTLNHYRFNVPWLQQADHYFPGVGDTSTYMVLLIPIFILWFQIGDKITIKLIAILGIIGVIYTGYMTLNRMIWPAIAVSLFLFVSLSIRYSDNQKIRPLKWPFLIVSLLMFIMIASFAAFTAKNHVQKHEDAVEHVANVMESDARWPIWGYWVKLIAAKPLFGYGYGRDIALRHSNIKMSVKEKRNVQPGFHGHNILLNQLSQLGVVGLILFLSLFWTLGRQYWNGLYDKESRVYALIGLTLMAGYLAKNMTDDFYTRQNLYYFWAMNGVLLRAIMDGRNENDRNIGG